MQSNQDLLQGDLLTKETSPDIHIPPGYAVVLSSPYGIEGVFNDPAALAVRVAQLRELGAYRNEDLAVVTHKVNAIA